jgi:hypothetical protein
LNAVLHGRAIGCKPQKATGFRVASKPVDCREDKGR